MNVKNISAIEALLFVVIANAILLAGADFPPPSGFVWIVLTSLILACGQFVYGNWLFRNIKDGKTLLVTCLLSGCAGCVTALLFVITSGGMNAYVWISVTVVTVVFLGYGLFFWIINRWLFTIKRW